MRKPQPWSVRHYVEWAKGFELDNGEPYAVEDYFQRFLQDVFDGFSVCWLVVPEENAKTTNVGGLALYVTEFRTNAYVPVAASSRDQAEWIYRQAEGLVVNSGFEDDTRSTAQRSDTPHMWRCLEGYRRIRHDATNSRIQIFAADDRGGDGIIPGGIAVLDELHRHRDLALYRTWRGKLRKRGAILVVMSTAGEVGGEFEQARSELLSGASRTERRGRCFVRAEKTLDQRKIAVLHDYAVPKDGDMADMALVKEANPFSGITVQSLSEKYAMQDDLSHWARFTCNVAARSDRAAITEAEWSACRPAWQPLPHGEPIWAGLDVAWKWDSTALVPFWPESPQARRFGVPTILHPPRTGDSLDSHLVEAALLDVHDRNPIHTLVMDTSKAEQLAQWAREQLGCEVVDRQQSNALAALDYEKWMDALRKKWLQQPGDPEFTSHVMNAIARELPGGTRRFDRPVLSRRGNQAQQKVRLIDALSAASMVHCVYAAELDAEEETTSWRAV